MNNTGEYGRRYINERAGAFRAARREAKAPGWLVAICRLILIFENDELRGTLAALLAIGAVALLALVAGAMSIGAIPLANGIIICAALGIMALFATRDL